MSTKASEPGRGPVPRFGPRPAALLLGLFWCAGLQAGGTIPAGIDPVPHAALAVSGAEEPAVGQPRPETADEGGGWSGQPWQDLFLVVRGARARLARDLRYHMGIGSDRVARLPTVGKGGSASIRRKWLNATVSWEPAEGFILSASYSHLLLTREKRESRFRELAAPPERHDPLAPARATGVICLKATLHF